MASAVYVAPLSPVMQIMLAVVLLNKPRWYLTKETCSSAIKWFSPRIDENARSSCMYSGSFFCWKASKKANVMRFGSSPHVNHQADFVPKPIADFCFNVLCQGFHVLMKSCGRQRVMSKVLLDDLVLSEREREHRVQIMYLTSQKFVFFSSCICTWLGWMLFSQWHHSYSRRKLL